MTAKRKRSTGAHLRKEVRGRRGAGRLERAGGAGGTGGAGRIAGVLGRLLGDSRRETLAAAAVLFGLCYIRYLYFGFRYAYMLDDYIQYHNYAAFHEGLAERISTLGLLAARPLAGVADITVWTHFWGVMPLAIAIVTALFVAGALLLRSVFSRFFGCSYAFLAVLLLVPFNFEGAYWLSASSRAVCGLFFAALSLWLLVRFLDCKRAHCASAHYAVLFFLSGLAACGFYEQALAFFVTASLLVSVLHVMGGGRVGRALWGLLCLPAAGFYFVFTTFFSGSMLYGERLSQFVIPLTPYYMETVLPPLLSQLKEAFLLAPAAITFKGAARGAAIIAGDFNFGFIAVALVLLAALCFLGLRERRVAGTQTGTRDGIADPKRPADGRQSADSRQSALYGMLFGLIICIACAAPFFVLSVPWFSLRGLLLCLPGIALILDRALFLITPMRAGRTVRAAVITAAAALFLLGSVSELHDYIRTYEKDSEVVEALSELRDGELVVLLNVKPSYLPDQNYFYHEHVHGVTESDWALTAALHCKKNSPYYSKAVPLSSGRALYYPSEYILSADKYYFVDADLNLHELTASYEDGQIGFFFEGMPFATFLYERGDKGFLYFEGQADSP